MLSLNEFRERACDVALSHLLKFLNDSGIQKQFIAETILKLGTKGENSLLKILSKENERDQFKLISCIYSAFAICDIHSPNIDFIVEALYKGCDSTNLNIKKSSILTIKILADKSDNQITLLKKEEIMHLYYSKLSDKSPEIQQVRFYFSFALIVF